ncbi:hypothetical protein [Cernens ardua]|uniref:hypothetical protein n=1 Tax=Cernens ardua TaxID=3402176 RepID=UPI003F9CD732
MRHQAVIHQGIESVVKRITVLLGFTVGSAFAATPPMPQTHALLDNHFATAGTATALPSQTLQPVSSTAVQIYPAAVEASLPSAATGTSPEMGASGSNTLAPSAHMQAPPPMNGTFASQPAPFAYGNRDLCGLQTLLVIEAMQQDRTKPHMSFDQFNIDIIRRFFESKVLDNLSDDKKVYFINLIHQNAQAAYAQGWKPLPSKPSSQRDDKLKTLMWQQCDADLSHP